MLEIDHIQYPHFLAVLPLLPPPARSAAEVENARGATAAADVEAEPRSAGRRNDMVVTTNRGCCCS